MSRTAIVSLSGGMDSTATLAKAIREGVEVKRAIAFRYGSKHGRHENNAARAIAASYGIPFSVLDISAAMQFTTSNLLAAGDAIPEGYYEAESMRLTVVPGRNSIFIAILASIAESEGISEVWLGIHSGDHHIYPDCRPAFFDAMDNAVIASSDGRVSLVAPYLLGDKASILRENIPFGVPFALTRTCYTDNAIACGRCGSCQERLAAFASIGEEDPLPYASRDLIAKDA